MNVQEGERGRNKLNLNRITARCIIIKMEKFKYKEKILKTARKKNQSTRKIIQKFIWDHKDQELPKQSCGKNN